MAILSIVGFEHLPVKHPYDHRNVRNDIFDGITTTFSISASSWNQTTGTVREEGKNWLCFKGIDTTTAGSLLFYPDRDLVEGSEVWRCGLRYWPISVTNRHGLVVLGNDDDNSSLRINLSRTLPTDRAYIELAWDRLGRKFYYRINGGTAQVWELPEMARLSTVYIGSISLSNMVPEINGQILGATGREIRFADIYTMIETKDGRPDDWLGPVNVRPLEVKSVSGNFNWENLSGIEEVDLLNTHHDGERPLYAEPFMSSDPYGQEISVDFKVPEDAKDIQFVQVNGIVSRDSDAMVVLKSAFSDGETRVEEKEHSVSITSTGAKRLRAFGGLNEHPSGSQWSKENLESLQLHLRSIRG